MKLILFSGERWDEKEKEMTIQVFFWPRQSEFFFKKKRLFQTIIKKGFKKIYFF